MNFFKMHARRSQRSVPEMDVSANKTPSKQRVSRFQLSLKARLIFIYTAALAGLLVLLVFIALPLRAINAPTRDLSFSQGFLKAASSNLSSWREQLFLETIKLQSATERSVMSRGQPQGHSRFDLFNPVVHCLQGELLEVFGGGQDDADGEKYLCPSLLTRSRNCVVYSLGSKLDYSFEQDILQRTNCQVVTFDCNVEGTSVHPRHTFLKKCLGNTAAMEANPDEWITLPAAMAQFGHNSITLLKIDIEGYEFDVLGAYTKVKNKHALPAMIGIALQ